MSRSGISNDAINILAELKKTDVYWAFEVTTVAPVTYRWAKRTIASAWDSESYTCKIISQGKLIQRRSGSEAGIQAASTFSFRVANKDNTLDAADFKNAEVKVSLVMTATVSDTPTTDAVASFLFRAVRVVPRYQALEFYCEDWLQSYLKGHYPNGNFSSDAFPTDNDSDKGLCEPLVIGSDAYIPIPPVISEGAVYYILGESDGTTYTITEFSNPKEWTKKATYSSGSYTFTQSDLVGGDGVTYRVVQPLCVDNDNDSNYENTFFRSGKILLPFPCKFSRDDTDGYTNPADAIDYVLQGFGIAAGKIVGASKSAADTIYDDRSLTFRVGLWGKIKRKTLLARLCLQCHTDLVPTGDGIYFKPLATASQLSITKGMVMPDGFGQPRSLVQNEQKDSCSVAWQESGKPTDSLVKSRIPAKATTDMPADKTIEMPDIPDSQNVQIAAQLACQLLFLPESEIPIRCDERVLKTEPGDFITLPHADYGGSFVALIDQMAINEDASVEITLIKFSDTMDDWGDLEPGVITVVSDTVTGGLMQVVCEGGEFGVAERANQIPGKLWAGTTILLDPAGDGKIQVGSGLVHDEPFNIHDKLYWDDGNSKLVVDGAVTAIEGAIGGLTLADGYLYGLASGTPTASPSDGIVVASGNPGVIVYENTEKRVEVGYLSAGVYGLKVYDDNGSTVIFEMSDTQKIIAGAAIGTGSEIAIQGWAHDLVFSVTDANTIAWGSGTITLMNGDAFSIDAGNTGNMAAETFVYLDIGTSVTVLQTTTTKTTAVGLGKIMVAICENATDEAEFIVFGSSEGNMDAGKIRANSITANEIAANTITATEIAASTITASQINGAGLGTLTITSGKIDIETADGLEISGSGNVKVLAGRDIELVGSDTDPGRLHFSGTSYGVEMGGDVDGDRFLIKPDTVDQVICYIGYGSAWWGDGDCRFSHINLTASRTVYIVAGTNSGENNQTYLLLDGNTATVEPSAQLYLYDKTAQAAKSYYFKYGSFYPSNNNTQDLGTGGNKWRDCFVGRNADIGGTLGVTGAATLSSTLDVTGAVDIGGIVDFTRAGTLKMWTYSNEALADDGYVDLPSNTTGFGFIWGVVSGGNNGGATFGVKNDSSISGAGFGNGALTDSDGHMCVFDNGTNVRVRNRLGDTAEVRIVYFYN